MFRIKTVVDYEAMIVPPRFKRMVELVDKYKPNGNFTILEYGGGGMEKPPNYYMRSFRLQISLLLM
jgi:hypothetical protein